MHSYFFVEESVQTLVLSERIGKLSPVNSDLESQAIRANGRVSGKMVGILTENVSFMRIKKIDNTNLNTSLHILLLCK